ncbi:HAD domain-containing protein [Clostridium folliculivorans]|uniref:HAD domain-containing protein n=1 Tax=Clostridium folliculivorans TaxID=2886038 RepID=UPI0021C3517F|nr:HAD domain-containing protein [Clostridium folliculivorans]GKU32273.1 hypothetical protein CFB3_43810 [Clostridium folliculivorans]
MKILFLDIDGVLNLTFWNSDNEREISEGKFIDSEKVLLLSKIIHETDAKIVLHSGWRFWFDDNMKPLRDEAIYFNEILKAHNLFIYDKTPDLTTEEIRKSKKFSLVKAREILLWLNKYDSVEEYLVLDDLDLNDKEIEVHQIKTDANVGLTKENVLEAIKLLNLKTLEI